VVISILGKDLIGGMSIEELKKMGVVADYVVRREGIISLLTMSLFDIPSKDNQDAGIEVNNNAYSNLKSSDACLDPIKSSRVFITDLLPISVSVEISAKVYKYRIPIAFTLPKAQEMSSESVYEKGNGEIYQLADYCFSNEDNFINWQRKDDLAAAIKDALHKHPGIILVVTRGDKGCVIAASSEEIQIPRFQVEQIDDKENDDSYYGAFLYTHKGLGWNLLVSCVLAFVVSAISR
jgi:sugar/nucleoside kinase (ribokinase family)